MGENARGATAPPDGLQGRRRIHRDPGRVDAARSLNPRRRPAGSEEDPREDAGQFEEMEITQRDPDPVRRLGCDGDEVSRLTRQCRVSARLPKTSRGTGYTRLAAAPTYPRRASPASR